LSKDVAEALRQKFRLYAQTHSTLEKKVSAGLDLLENLVKE
jgi:hypothetical protein